ncbi:MAG: hypothetical protein PHQ98_03515 [Candidatus ainarchaeum sp.]|nr:hypothetical protein [Candidatus ainarchaeum sp.]
MGVFIAGFLFSFGFTAPFAVVFLLSLSPENIFLAALIGGVGSMVSDLLILRFVKISFENEFIHLRKEKPVLFLKQKIDLLFNPKLKHYLFLAFAGILFASPLPDEAAIMLISSVSQLSENKIALIGLVCNTLGILIILLL